MHGHVPRPHDRAIIYPHCTCNFKYLCNYEATTLLTVLSLHTQAMNIKYLTISIFYLVVFFLDTSIIEFYYLHMW